MCDTIDEIIRDKGLAQGYYYFKIVPVAEPNKPLLTNDEIMRLQILNPDRIHHKVYAMDEVVAMLTFFAPFVPIWINVYYIEHKDNKIYFGLDCSLRIRKPSLMHNQETGHPPFKAII